MLASRALVYRHANSRDSAMKTQRVKTCQDSPTMETSTAVREPPEEVEEGAADGLEDEREDVAGDEDPVVEFRGEARVFGAEVDDAVGTPIGQCGLGGKEGGVRGVLGLSHLGEGEVDCCCVPDGAEGDADYTIPIVSAVLVLGLFCLVCPIPAGRMWDPGLTDL